MSTSPSLLDRHAGMTRELILNSAVELLEQGGLRDVTVKAIARQAGMSERTVFRHFAAREELLDAVAMAASRVMPQPEPPATAAVLPDYARDLYASFESRSALVRAALHSDIYPRLREVRTAERGRALRAIVDAAGPNRSALERKLAAANLRYYLSASTWNYLRLHLGFAPAEAVAAAQAIIRAILKDLGRRG